jgi:hypothetical protein
MLEEVVFRYDSDDAKGEVRIVNGTYGPSIVVNGVEVGWVDLFNCVPANGGGLPQFCLNHPEAQDLAAKVLIQPDRLILVVNGETPSARGPCPQGIHSDRKDVVYTIDMKGEEDGE